MKKKSFILSIFLMFTAASLVLALLFAPLRSYYSAGYIEHAVAISGIETKKIKNAKASGKAYSNVVNNLEIETTSTKKARKAVRTSTSSSERAMPGIYQAPKFQNNKSGGIKTHSGRSGSSVTTSKSPAAEIPAGIFNPSFTNTKKPNGNKPEKESLIAPSPALSSGLKATTKAKAGGPPPEEGIGDTVTPTPTLPIGDGYVFLLLLATATAIIKLKKMLA